jgi:hypothetical protein
MALQLLREEVLGYSTVGRNVSKGESLRLAQVAAEGVKFEDAGVDGSTFGYFLYKANEIGTKWNKWATKSKEFINGHEILITGWDATGFKILTWDGTGHMSYEYWYIHALDAQVVVSELWINALQNKDKKLLLNTLL